jgi:(4-alkanoyl-5-oxo-2,5-dihydrofuran-3-yl)methyl phosphate reductase
MTYLITGATGEIGSHVIEQLIARGDRPRVFVRDAAKAHSRFGNHVDVFVGDLGNPESLAPALKGAGVLFLVNSGPQIPVLDEQAATTAKAAGIKRLVKLSSMDVEQNLAIGAWHQKGESAIRALGIPFTFVRPTGFMSNLLAWARSIKTEGVVRASTGNGRRPFVHSRDIASVAVKAITTCEYEGQSLPMTGPEAVTFAEATARIGAAIGKALRFEPISDEEAGRRFAASGAAEEEVKAHIALWRAIRQGHLATVTNSVQRILGRQPITLDQWITENAAAFRDCVT